MYIEIGPAGITVSGEKDGLPYKFEKEKLEETVKDILEGIKECLPVLKQKAYKIKRTAHLPDVAKNMIHAVKMVDEATLTPMAAVAGAVADAVREHFKDMGLDFISINNGGDISIFNRYGRLLKIGLGDISRNRTTPYTIRIEGLKNHGVASSGFGGRSFTLGLADIVTVISSTGALADAAATFICNHTDAETDKVTRRAASEIDPLTDIPYELVTVSIGEINKGVIAKALENGLRTSNQLKKSNIIYDAVIILRGEVVTTINGDKHITLEVQNGN